MQVYGTKFVRFGDFTNTQMPLDEVTDKLTSITGLAPSLAVCLVLILQSAISASRDDRIVCW